MHTWILYSASSTMARRSCRQEIITVCILQEVVSLNGSSHRPANELHLEPARHLPAEEWHSALQSAAGGEPVALLDARNIYETRIGHFQAVRPSPTPH